MESLYTNDFFAWTQRTAELLKNRQFDVIDTEHLIEEVESLGKHDRDKLISSLKILIAHLLKWQYQPEKRSKSWEDTIFRERENIAEYLEDMPSLIQFLHSEEWMTKAYKRAKKLASRETGINEGVFAENTPYTEIQLLDFEFLPR